MKVGLEWMVCNVVVRWCGERFGVVNEKKLWGVMWEIIVLRDVIG